MKKQDRPSSQSLSARKRGQAPGARLYVGPARSHTVQITALDYTPTRVRELVDPSIEELAELRDAGSVTWVNLDGVHDLDAVHRVCATFGLHPLAEEDILNAGSRVKVEDYGEAVFAVVKMVLPGDGEVLYTSEQVAVVLGPKWVLTFQERQGDLFEPTRNRIRNGTGRIRSLPADFLMHAVLDAIVDGYFAVLERVDEAVSVIEQAIVDESDPDTAHTIHHMKSELVALRRRVSPLREATAELLRSEGKLVRAQTLPFVRDLRDHVLQVIDLTEAYRERLTSALELSLAMSSRRMNEVMRVLTVVSTLFIPLTFLAGIYGMNFRHMPELEWPWAYPAVLVVMGGIFVGMLGWLRRRNWF